MSFRRMTEEGEIGEEEGEIVATNQQQPSPPPPPASNALRPPPPPPPPPPFRRNNSTGIVPTTTNINTANAPNFRDTQQQPQQGFRGGAGRGGRFPGRGRGGRGRGGRGVSRHHSWTAGQGTGDGQPQATSRWGPTNSSVNESRRDSFQSGGAPPPPHQSSPTQRNPSFVGSSSSMPPRKPSFARAESTGSMGGAPQQRNFPPSTPPFNRSESFGARQIEPQQQRNEPFRGGNNDGFQSSPPPFARQESYGRQNEQRNEPFRGTTNESFQHNPAPFSRQDSFGGRPNEPRNEPPFRGSSNEDYGPTLTFSRNESFGARQNEQQQPRNEPFRGGNNNANDGFPNRDAFGRAERPQRAEDAFGRAERPSRTEDAFGRQPQHPSNQSEMHSITRSGPPERGSSVSSGPPPQPFPSAPPPPPPNLPPPPPPNLPPPPSQQQPRHTSSYSSLADKPPPIAPPTIQRSPSYTGPPASPSMPRRTSSFSGGDMRPPMRSPPQKDRRKMFDLLSSSSPQLTRQASAPSRFPDGDSFRSALPPPPPVTSSQLLSQQPSPTPRPWQASPESPKKQMQQPEAETTTTSSPPKRPSEPKLTCASLGDPRIAARAEQVISQMNKLVSFPQPTAGEVVLPSKQLIMKAVAGLDLQIKKGQTNVKSIQTELEEMVQAEEAEAKRVEKERREQEQKRQDAETKKLEQERKEREEKRLEEHRKKVQVVIDERKRVLEEEQRRAQEALGEHIKRAQTEEHITRTREVQGQIEVAAQTFDKDIAKAQKALEKATQDTALAETKMAKVVAEYKQSKENEAALPDLSREHERESPEMRAMIARIQAENKRRAQQAQLDSMYLLPYTPNAGSDSNVKTNEEWTNEARKVTGLANALYTEPSESPFYEKNNRTHALIEPIVTEIVRDKKRRLQDKWEGLAEEYLVRKDIYDKTHTVLHKEKHSTPTSHPSIFGSKPSPINSREAAAPASGGRATSNPYRRARRGQVGGSGDVVRSEYEQEQIIAELTAKEAMEKRIKHGGSKLPRQICQLEKDLNGTYIQTFEARHVDDPLEESREQKNTNIWSDMEKCIFLDRFLQHPKDFRKIASFLRNKSTKDCIAFYYDSKQSVPYKKALKEFIMRRKRRGDYHVWDSTIQASLSVGAVVTAGTSESKPLTFSLPESDKTYFTRNFHPLNRELLDRVDVNAADVDIDMLSPKREGKNRKRPADAPLFTLDPSQRKLLRSSSNDKGGEDSEEMDEGKAGEKTPTRSAPQKWTAAEKRAFHDTLEKYGKNWSLLAAAISTKNMKQIKNYYYDHKKEHKKQFGRSRSSGDGDTRSSVAGSTDGESDFAERTEMYLAAGAAQLPTDAMRSAAEVVELSEQQRAALNAQSIQSAADMWARAQIEQRQAQHLQEQQLQQHLSSQEARRLLHSHQHQQVISNISSMFPWVTAAHVAQAQAQAAALQQQQQPPPQQAQQQQPQQENAGIDWTDQATKMQNLLAMRQAQAGAHHNFAVDPNSHIRSMALAGLAAMNQQSLAGSGLVQQQQVDNASYAANEADRASNEGASSSNAALALGMLAQQSMNNGQPDETESAEQYEQ